jgi:hypothetical protein
LRRLSIRSCVAVTAILRRDDPGRTAQGQQCDDCFISRSHFMLPFVYVLCFDRLERDRRFRILPRSHAAILREITLSQREGRLPNFVARVPKFGECLNAASRSE